MGQGCSCADSNDKEQEVRTDAVSNFVLMDSRDKSRQHRASNNL